MRLTDAQMQQFRAEGWLFLRELFSPEEVAVLREATVTRLVEEGGIVAPTSKPGGMLMFHGSLMRLSAEHPPYRARSSI